MAHLIAICAICVGHAFKVAWPLPSARRLRRRQIGGIRGVISVSFACRSVYRDRMATPNSALRAVRMGLLMSQDDFARAVREAGTRAGVPNGANKRLVQRWESGEITAPRPVYARALEAVTGLPIESLGFAPVSMARVSDDGQGGHDVQDSPVGVPASGGVPTPQAASAGNLSGIWLSTYEYFSSGRDATFTG
jgi:DNA-binding transcriptional regulator YiaG